MRTCNTCSKELTITNQVQEGFYCCEEYYCSEKCVNASLKTNSLPFETPETWHDHYEGSDSECYWTEWELA